MQGVAAGGGDCLTFFSYFNQNMRHFTYTIALCALWLPSLTAAGRITDDGKADYRDSTKYFNRLNDSTFRQDPIYVFFDPKLGSLKAQRPQAPAKALFKWEKLSVQDTLVRQDTTFFQNTDSIVKIVSIYKPIARWLPLRADTALADHSALDSLSYGCYRALTDTVAIEIIDTTLYHNADTLNITPPCSARQTACNILTMPPDTCSACHRFTTDTSAGYAIVRRRTLLRPADTMRAWVFVDTFKLCGIHAPPPERPCDNPVLIGRYYSLGADNNNCSQDPNGRRYIYYDLADTLLETRRIPDYQDRYIKSVKWEASEGEDIYKDGKAPTGDNADPSWNTRLNTEVPRPLWSVAYKLTIENFFGSRADTISDTIKAHAVFAKIETANSKDGTAWEEFADPNGGEGGGSKKYDAPLYFKVRNTSVNANAGGDPLPVFEWKFYDENKEDTSLSRPPKYAHTTSVPDEEIDLHQKFSHTYNPGTYPLTMKVTNTWGCADSVKIMVEVKDFIISEHIFNKVFSPASSNEDNKYFKIKSSALNGDSLNSVSRFEISVMNRYGQLIYTSTDLEFKWDGKIRGSNSPAPDGVYFYVVRARGLNKDGKMVEQKLNGTVHLFGSDL